MGLRSLFHQTGNEWIGFKIIVQYQPLYHVLLRSPIESVAEDLEIKY